MVAARAKVLACLVCGLCVLVPVATQPGDFLEDCQSQKMDVVFVQDASFSVSNTSFEMAKTFISGMVRQLPVGLNKTRVALVRYGTNADIIIRLNESSDVITVTEAVSGMEFITGGTLTGRALRTVRTEVLKEERLDTRAVVVIITDGASNDRMKAERESQNLRDHGVRLVWLYISNDGRMGREREAMAKKGDITYGVGSFDDLGNATMMQILNASCQEPEPEITTPETPATTTTPETTSYPSAESEVPDPGSRETSSSLESTVVTVFPETSSFQITQNTGKPSPQTSQKAKTSSPQTTHKTETLSFTLESGTSLSKTTEKVGEGYSEKDRESTSVPKFQTPDRTTSEPTSTERSNAVTQPRPKTDASPGPLFSQKPKVSTNPAANIHTIPSDTETSSTSPALSRADAADNRASKSQSDDKGTWEDSWPIIIGGSVGVASLAALSAGVIHLVLVRRRKKRDNKNIRQEP